jgi:hypothetical protein
MEPKRYTFNFKDGPITVWAINLEEAEVCAKAEAIRNGWDYHINGRKKIANPVDLITIDKCLMCIIEMEDADTLDEQLDCIEALKKLRNKLKDKESAK